MANLVFYGYVFVASLLQLPLIALSGVIGVWVPRWWMALLGGITAGVFIWLLKETANWQLLLILDTLSGAFIALLVFWTKHAMR